MNETFEIGQWNVCCDQCGERYKARQLRLQWDNLRTCFGPGTNNCWDQKHPQLSLRGKADRQAPPWVRPPPPDIELTTNQVRAEDL